MAIDVAGVDRHLAAEAAPDVGADHADLLLGEPNVARHQREHGADGVRRLGGHVDRQVPLDRVEVGEAAAGLDRRHVDARHMHLLAHHDIGLIKDPVRGFLVARLPVPDVVVGLAFLVGAEHRRIVLERLEGVHDGRHGLVFDLDRGHSVGGRIARGCDHPGHLLRLVHHGVRGEHHLGVRHEGRHPVQPVRLQVLAREHGEHAGNLERLGGVDVLDFAVGDGAPDDVQPEHPRQREVVDVVALALQEARVFLALHGVAHAADLGGCSRCHQSPLPRLRGGVLDRLDDVHVSGAAAEIPGDGLADLGFAGVRIAFEQRGPGHEHAGRAEAALEAVLLLEALLQRGHAVGPREPLHGADLGPVGLHGQDGARLHGHAVHQHGAGAAVRGVAADVGAGEREVVADQVHQQEPRVDGGRVRFAVHGDVDVVCGHRFILLRARAPCGWHGR